MDNYQVGIDNYDFDTYVHKGRWISYWHQLHEITKSKSNGKICVIGVGDNIVPYILSSLGYEVVTFDFDARLNPDVVGDVKNVDSYFMPEEFDGVLCCQILEHLEGYWFEIVLEKIKIILKEKGLLVISLPQSNAPVQVRVDVPKIHFKINKSINKFKKKVYKFDGEHYWEVDTAGYSKKSIIGKCNKKFEVLNAYTVFEYAYHFFIILQKQR